MELRGKNIVVVGMARTGIATARFLLYRGARVTVSEAKPAAQLPAEALALAQQGVLLETGGHRMETLRGAELIVVSPGVPLDIAPLREADNSGIEIISEIELAYRFLQTPLIAVTGTNGKTTTTSLLADMFRHAGKQVFVGGNIGTPLIAYVSGTQDRDFVIAEISSFQLEGIKSFRPFISVLLNITEDHLDRYQSFADYSAAKGRIFLNQAESDIAVLNYDDPQVREMDRAIRAQKVFFSTRQPLPDGISYNGVVHLRLRGEDAHIAIAGALLVGIHNVENMMAAAAVGFVCGLSLQSMQQALVRFSGLKHRMELVDQIRGVTFYNDSKATNVGAVVKSLESLPAPLVLIAGGKDKGGSYAPLQSLLRQKVKLLVLLGEARERMRAELGGEVETVMTSSLDEAVRTAFSRSDAGDTVLFSPACSSFDMFTSYEHRGACFKELVSALKK
jgi:UDP-N-acetylmuramoylalanine--D-glutamate ligase